jgi:Tol biopolymer transport system component
MRSILSPIVAVTLAISSPTSAQQLAVREIADVSAVGPNVFGVTVSPDGRYIAILPARRGPLWLMDREAGTLRDLELGAGQTRWAPGGRELVFNRVGEDKLVGVYTLAVTDGAMLRKVESDPVDSYTPIYSPRGDSIAFVGTVGCDNDWLACYRLVAVPSRGGERRVIAADVGFAMDWSRDGRWIYYGLGADGGITTYHRVSVAGDRKEQIAATGDRRSGPDIGLSPDDRFFAISLAPVGGSAVHTVVVHTAEGRELLRRDLPEGVVPQGWTSGNDLIGLVRGARRTVVEIELSSLLPR